MDHVTSVNLISEQSNELQDVLSILPNDHFSQTKSTTCNYLVFRTDIDEKTNLDVNIIKQKYEKENHSVIQLNKGFLLDKTNSSIFSNITFLNETMAYSAVDSSIDQKLIIEDQHKNERVKRKQLKNKRGTRKLSTHYLKFSEKYLTPTLFKKVKSHIEKQRSIFGDF
ncbi:uncharacterized protein LOC126907079 [Daktulosphaira vitifoliae]|uniref:uncharacterized protein LOC126907079 n=1 Tax=Daktulosphaira vitifoliae TaxID=58002 RepID=UPI0021AA9BB4|nr:uncharacterized protein LOC126907079 [Daktulosphaira vitifoliae]